MSAASQKVGGVEKKFKSWKRMCVAGGGGEKLQKGLKRKEKMKKRTTWLVGLPKAGRKQK